MEAQTKNLLSTPLSYKEQQEYFYAVMADAENGGVDPLEIMLRAKALSRICELIIEGEKDSNGNLVGFAGIKDHALTEAQKHIHGSVKEFEYMGVKIKVGELGTKYDYANCGDTAWESMSQQLLSLTEAMKTRQEFLKTFTSPKAIADELTGGELVTIAPPIKRSTTGLSFKF